MDRTAPGAGKGCTRGERKAEAGNLDNAGGAAAAERPVGGGARGGGLLVRTEQACRKEGVENE
jgi:hypothetical protein